MEPEMFGHFGVFSVQLGRLVSRTRGSRLALIVAVLAAGAVTGSLSTGAPVAHALAPNTISTVAGGGGSTSNGVPALTAAISTFGNNAATADAAGDIFILDAALGAVREVPAKSGTYFGQSMKAGHIYTIAGNGQWEGQAPVSGVPATKAILSAANSIAVDAAANVLITESGGSGTGGVVQEVANASGTHFGVSMRTGYLYTVAGNNQVGPSGDGGPARSAALDIPSGVTVDPRGNLLFSERGGGDVREVAALAGTRYGVAMKAGDIYTVAGGQANTCSGDGCSARSVTLSNAGGVALDAAGDLFVSAVLSNPYVAALVVSEGTGRKFGSSMTAGHIYQIVSV